MESVNSIIEFQIDTEFQIDPSDNDGDTVTVTKIAEGSQFDVLSAPTFVPLGKLIAKIDLGSFATNGTELTIDDSVDAGSDLVRIDVNDAFAQWLSTGTAIIPVNYTVADGHTAQNGLATPGSVQSLSHIWLG